MRLRPPAATTWKEISVELRWTSIKSSISLANGGWDHSPGSISRCRQKSGGSRRFSEIEFFELVELGGQLLCFSTGCRWDSDDHFFSAVKRLPRHRGRSRRPLPCPSQQHPVFLPYVDNISLIGVRTSNTQNGFDRCCGGLAALQFHEKEEAT